MKSLLYFLTPACLFCIVTSSSLYTEEITRTRITNLDYSQSEPAIAINQLDNSYLMAVYNDWEHSSGEYPSAGYAFSTDGGQTWPTQDIMSPDPAFHQGVDPSCAIDLHGNSFYCYLADDLDQRRLYVSRWRNEEWEHNIVAHDPLPGLDKPYMAIDNISEDKNENIYVTWRNTRDYTIGFRRSTDSGVSWEPPLVLDTAPNVSSIVHGPVPVVGNNGCLHVFWLYAYRAIPGTDAEIRYRKSTDGGSTWDPPLTEEHGRTLPDDGYTFPLVFLSSKLGSIQIASFPTAAADPNKDNIYVAYTHKEEEGEDLNISYLRSTDAGDTWSDPEIATENQTNWQCFPWLTVDEIGNVHLVYYHAVQPNPDPLIDVYIATSINEGVSFLPNDLKITEVPSDPSHEHKHHYIGITSTTGIALTVWTDFQHDNPEIYFAEVDYTESGSITSDETWSQYVLVTGDVTINNGAAVTVDEGVAVEFVADSDDQNSGLDPSLSELIVNGELDATGTVSKKITFNSSRPTPYSDWFGIRSENGSTVTLQYCNIWNANEGVRVANWTGDVDISSSNLFNNSEYGIHVIQSIGTNVYGNDIVDSPIGIFIQNNDEYNCDQITIDGNILSGEYLTIKGIYVEAKDKWGGEVTIKNNIIVPNTTWDLLAAGIGAKALWNGIPYHPDETPYIEISRNTIYNCDQLQIGVEKYDSDIVDNTLNLENPGVWDNCSFGIMIHNGNSYVRENSIEDAGNTAIWTSTNDANLGTESDHGDNDVSGSAVYHVKNTSGETVWALYNWWDPISIGKFYGDVRWYPYN